MKQGKCWSNQNDAPEQRGSNWIFKNGHSFYVIYDEKSKQKRFTKDKADTRTEQIR
ncbi:hypothetical protein ACQCVB_08800 [Fictibacillus phosphorivorans]|uniref:hypothetical protein n=1 Tax=Fictibacillus phosphorivorans TaxID=1221500 RepID=UPI003CF75190